MKTSSLGLNSNFIPSDRNRQDYHSYTAAKSSENIDSILLLQCV